MVLIRNFLMDGGDATFDTSAKWYFSKVAIKSCYQKKSCLLNPVPPGKLFALPLLKSAEKQFYPAFSSF